ncbi:lipoprotein [Spiroplasma mirum]|nr:lipoprotein [Spiroplasma atrichopogonis]AKM52804.1 hypothetical protein SATRI_v1c02450 [Spiroplasma atrichopogonis]
MKKLLSILGFLSLIGTSAISVVACSGTSGSVIQTLY